MSGAFSGELCWWYVPVLISPFTCLKPHPLNSSSVAVLQHSSNCSWSLSSGYLVALAAFFGLL